MSELAHARSQKAGPAEVGYDSFLGYSSSKNTAPSRPEKSRLWFRFWVAGRRIITYFTREKTSERIITFFRSCHPGCSDACPGARNACDVIVCHLYTHLAACLLRRRCRVPVAKLPLPETLGSNRPCRTFRSMRIVCVCVMSRNNSFGQNSCAGREEMERQHQA